MKNNVQYFYCEENTMELIFHKNSKMTYPEHNHISTYTIGIVLDGDIHLKRMNTVVEYGKDDFFLIPPYEPHQIRSLNSTYSMLTLCISEALIVEKDINNIVLIFQELAEFLWRKDIICRKQIKMFSKSIIILLNGIVKEEEFVDEAILVSKEILETSMEQLVNIEKLAKRMNISQYHYIRIFKEKIGLSPYRFQLQNRIRRAQRLMRQGNKITEVALATGFYDQSHFDKTFKKLIGMSPFKYRSSITKIPLKN